MKSEVCIVEDDGTLSKHHLEPGVPCPACDRKVPKKASDSSTGPARDRLSIAIPTGEEGVLEQMLVDLVDKYADAWPEDAAAARDGVGLAVVGGRAWRYRALHFAVYAALTVPGLEPAEGGA